MTEEPRRRTSKVITLGDIDKLLRETTEVEEEPQHRKRKKELKNADLQQDIKLKKTVARVALIVLAVQLFVADGAFIAYAHYGMQWKIPDPVILGWLSATVVQVIGIVFVITSYLFPKRNGIGKK